MQLVSIATPIRRSRPIAAVICWLLLAAPIFGQTKDSGRNDVNDSKNPNPADIVKKVLEVNSVWLDTATDPSQLHALRLLAIARPHRKNDQSRVDRRRQDAVGHG